MKVAKITRDSYEIDTSKIRIARAEKGWTITKLSEESKVSRHTIGNIEKGKYKYIQFGTIEKIADALEKTIEDFKKE